MQRTRAFGLGVTFAGAMCAWSCAVEPVSPNTVADVENAAVGPELPPGAPDRPVDVQRALSNAAPVSDARLKHRTSDGRPRFTNRLVQESSPYLRQHAHNPVDWHPWGDDAFELAARLGRPVFLSIGYATCHWCHVMEEESFEDLEIAAFINAHTIPIKVDREERPDVDHVYLAAVRLMTGGGGWPATLWLTPDRRPFYGGTYFPPRAGDRGAAMGLLDILRRMDEAWSAEPDKVVELSGQIVAALELELGREGPAGDLPPASLIDQAMDDLSNGYDPRNGGVRARRKFPSSLPLRLLMRAHLSSDDPQPLEMATRTLDAMAAGGIHDQLGGGFHRYTVDNQWRVPHFEKMLYDNALLAVAYVEAGQLTGDRRYDDVARRTLDYLLGDPRTDDGGFSSGFDADSLSPDGALVEGWCYTWTPAELEAVLGAEDAAQVGTWFGVSEAGQVDGRSVLYQPWTDADRAARPPPKEPTLARARLALLAERATRAPPAEDDKVLAGWNGLAISALAQGGRALDRASYLDAARVTAALILDQMVIDGRLRRSYRGGQARHPAVMADYAYVIGGLLDLFEATAEVRWLDAAVALDAVVRARFEDPEGGWYQTADDAPGPLVRARSNDDGAVPAGGSVHVRNLLRLSELTLNDGYRDRALTGLKRVAGRIAENPAYTPELLIALDLAHARPLEIVVVHRGDASLAAPLTHVLNRRFLPHATRLVLSETDAAPGGALAERVPWVSGKLARVSTGTAYVCQRGVCQAPVDTAEGLVAQLVALGR